MKKLLSILFFSYMAYLVFTTSCANPGMPTGGDKDTIPPVVIRTVPAQNARNYKENKVSLTFDEFVISDEVSTNLIVSPPLKQRPRVRTKSKTLTIELGDSLMSDVTYSLDFKDAIADNNEKNPLRDFRFAFSTGPRFDSLMIGGYVLNAENMEPVEDAIVLLYDGADSLSSFRKRVPKYIARTDEEGFYALTNLAAGKYRLFALEDVDNSLTYNQPGERIAFFDSLVVAMALESSSTAGLDSLDLMTPADSVKTKADSLLQGKNRVPGKVDPGRIASSGMTVPESLGADSLRPGRPGAKTRMTPHYLLMFQEQTYEQFLDDYTREQRDLIRFYFSNSLTDSFSVSLISPQPLPADWYYLEYGAGRDSVSLWLTDTLVSRNDTLMLQLKYQTLDSLENLVVKPDTVELIYTDPVKREKRRKKKEAAPVIQHFSFTVNARDGFDPYNPLVIGSPQPVGVFDYSKVRLYQTVDTLEEVIAVKPEQDSILKRRFEIYYPWEFEGSYRIEIDSAAAKTFDGKPSNPVNQKFTVQKESYYGRIFLNIGQVPGCSIVQLLKNTEKEEVLKQMMIREDGNIEFSFVKPEKYKIRLIVDRNQNGHWDTGDLDEWEQPERVVYYSKILKIRSNFDIHENWLLPDDIQPKKELIDDDPHAKKDKKNSQSNRKGLR